ncbi:aminotransferase class V-fold PLP-dependent enzyme [Pseudoalteromonas nigrifaciens]|uniref:aminotransferase class V-fold PLP-dependent enzyme n=1 Tax=Pseudoalteromonas nigrifaciens TaxID=28109 RepID=UPI003FD331FB
MRTRRTFLKSFASLGLVSLSSQARLTTTNEITPLSTKPTQDLVKDEDYWDRVRTLFPVQRDIINLEHGYWGKMATVVEEALASNTHKVNKELSWYARKEYKSDFIKARQSVSDALGVKVNELMLTRNATESFVNLITQYNGLTQQDSILWADTDYPSFQRKMKWLAKKNNIKGHRINLPSTGSNSDYIQAYKDAFENYPNLKLILLTHVSNQHGLILPIKEIAAMAKARGIEVICDCAQSWGLLNFQMKELGVDWAVFNLHKWIGSPVGVGALYMREGTLANVNPFPGEEVGDTDVVNRVHLATSDFAAFITVPKSIEFHNSIGAANKEARLKYLREAWVNEVKTLPEVEVLGGDSMENASGVGGFRLKNKTSREELNKLQARLQNEFGIFTVVRDSLSSGCCIRVTPQIFTPYSHIKALVTAIKVIAKDN